MDPNEASRLPGYLARVPLRGKAWQWAGVAAILHALLGLVLAAIERRLIHSGSLPAAFLRLDTIGVILSSAVVGGLVWLIAYFVERQLQADAQVRQRLFEIIDGLPDPASVKDMRGRYIMWNAAAERYHGIPRAHAIGKTPSDLFPPAVAIHFLEVEKRARQGFEAVETQFTLPALYGRPRRIVMVRVAPIRSADKSQRLRGVVAVLKDLTIAGERETEDKRHLIQLQLALEASGSGAWDWHLPDDVVHYSDGFRALLRYKGDDFRRDFLFRDRLHPDDRIETLAAVHRSIDLGAPFERQYRLECFDGRYRRFEARGVLLHDAWGHRHFAGLLSPARRHRPAAPDSQRPDA